MRISVVDRREFLVAGAALPLALAFERDALAARLKGSSRALVTADLESHVVVLDLETAHPVARIDTAPGPRAIEFVESRSARAAATPPSNDARARGLQAEHAEVKVRARCC